MKPEDKNKKTEKKPSDKKTAPSRPKRGPSHRGGPRSGGKSPYRGSRPGGKPSHGKPKKPGNRKVQRRPRNNPPINRPSTKKVVVPPIGDNIRIIPLGGVEEVGKNMTAIEVGDSIIIIDAGFQFKDDLTPGIDYIIPNTRYLEENKHKIKAMFITHGHLDHIGAIPYIIDKIGNPPIYTREFGAIMIQKRHTEFPHLPKLNMNVLDGDETTVIADDLKVESFAISHTIPDAMGLVIHTHLGDIVFVEDVRVDNIKGVPTDEEVDQYKRFKKNDNVLLLTMDSTSIEKPGWSLSESVVVENLEKIIKDTTGRLFIGTLELLTAILLLSGRFSASGAFLGIAIMLGAVIAHVTILGLSNSLLAFVVLILCLVVFVIRRKEFPYSKDKFREFGSR